MLLECTAGVNMIHLRDSARARQFRVLQQIERGEKGSPSPPLWMRQSLARFHRLCWSKDEPEVERLWLGTWNDETLAKVTEKEIADLTELIDHNERQLFRKNIKKLVAPLVELASELLTMRMEMINNLRRQNIPVVTPARPPAVRATPGGAIHSLSRAGFRVGRRPSTKGVDFTTQRESDGPPLTQSTMREAFQRRELSAIREEEVEDHKDADGEELAGLAEEDFPALDGGTIARGRAGSSRSSSSRSSISSGSSSSSIIMGSSSIIGSSDSRLGNGSVTVASGSAREVDSSACISASSSSVEKF
jgi:hypothetical protein